jgi:hypothetical protein
MMSKPGLREHTNFANDVKVYGPIGEQRLKEILTEKGHNFEDVSDVEEFRIFDIDILQYNNDETNSEKVLDAYYMGKTTSAADAVAYEVKTDTYGIVSRNIVFEDLSNSNSGCMARTKADYLFYVFVNKQNEIVEEYLINVKKLRWWLMSNFGKINKCDYLQSRSMRRGQDNTGILLINIDHLINDKTSGAVKL